MYLLDTCTVSDFFSGLGNTKQRLRNTSPAEVAITAITTMEVHYGFRLNAAVERKFSASFRGLCETVTVLPFDDAAAMVAADIRASLKKTGKQIGSFDLLIGAIALLHDHVLVTSNTREFERIEGLKIENWR